jgi:hypothetical protein
MVRRDSHGSKRQQLDSTNSICEDSSKQLESEEQEEQISWIGSLLNCPW